MALASIAVAGMVLEIVPQVPADATTGTITITGAAYAQADAGGSGIYQEGLQIKIASVTAPGAVATTPDPNPVTAAISAAPNRVTCGGVAILREGDETADLTATPLIPGSPPQSYATSFKVRIASAGQARVEAQ